MSTDRNRTTVINVRGHKSADLLGQPDFVYVGRAVPRRGWHDSIWGNPFRVGLGRDATASVELYREHIEASINLPGKLPSECTPVELDLQATALEICLQLELLRGKRLGCWCCDWDGIGEPVPNRPCHAVVLARLADGLDGLDDATDIPPLPG